MAREFIIIVMRFRAAAFAALITVASLVTSVLAPCMAGAMTPENAQMACCKGGHHKCGPSGSVAECCKKAEPRPQQLAAGKADPSLDPVRAFLVTFTTPQPHLLNVVAVQIPPDSSRGPTVGSSPPSHLLFSAFLI